MKRLGYPIALVLASLVSVVLFTTITAVTLASYSNSKADKQTETVVKQLIRETVKR